MSAAGVRPDARPRDFVQGPLLNQHLTFRIKNEHRKPPMQRRLSVVYRPLGTRAHRRIVVINKQDELFFSQGASPPRVYDSIPTAEGTAPLGGMQDSRGAHTKSPLRLRFSYACLQPVGRPDSTGCTAATDAAAFSG